MKRLSDEMIRRFYEHITGCKACNLKGEYEYCGRWCIPEKRYRYNLQNRIDRGAILVRE